MLPFEAVTFTTPMTIIRAGEESGRSLVFNSRVTGKYYGVFLPEFWSTFTRKVI